MTFNVGPWRWVVKIARGIYLDGEPCRGKANLDSRTIHLCAELPEQDRLQTLLHELWHAWEFELPKARGVEERCNLFALAAAATWADLESQGGVPALVAMIPEERISTAKLLQQWYGFAAELDNPDVELTADEFLPIVSTFNALSERGQIFDPTLISLMRLLESQMSQVGRDGEEHAQERNG